MTYGSFSDLKQKSTDFGQLSDARLRKLKQLSLVSFAESSRTLSYSSLLVGLELPSVDALEELTVSCIYNELLVAVLDQKRQQVEIQVR
jgi:COP9 signalosome complex subunit 7